MAGPDITEARDCNVYVLDMGRELVLVDSGFGAAVDQMVEHIKGVGLDPFHISSVLLTHCHIDHAGGAATLRDRFGARLYMHELDAAIVEQADQRLTAAFCFDVKFKPLPIDVTLTGSEGRLSLGGAEVNFLHTPGHTPGSISPYVEHHGTRILFGQDLGAPLLPEFDCDPVAWRHSMERLLALQADVLCDGHSGVYKPRAQVAAYIEHFIGLYGEEGRNH